MPGRRRGVAESGVSNARHATTGAEGGQRRTRRRARVARRLHGRAPAGQPAPGAFELRGARQRGGRGGVLLAGNRLLTLSGPGGSGKTRLALAVAHEVVEKYGDGAWFVELAPLSDPELVPQAVASLLGVRETPGRELTDTLTDHLRPRTLLLVLDNCEHLVDASASLAEALLRSCPKLRVLATSRQALGVEGEALFVVPPLSLPDPRRLPVVDGLHDYEAARLFVERARSARPRFEVTERNATAVTQICTAWTGCRWP